MADKAWKAWERKVAKLFNGRRRGPDTEDQSNQGKTDVIAEGWSIEVKLRGRPSWAVLQEDVRKAEARADAGDIPIAVMRKKGEPWTQALVAMSLPTFLEFFGPVGGSDNGAESS